MAHDGAKWRVIVPQRDSKRSHFAAGTRYPFINEVVLAMLGSGSVLRGTSEHGPDLAPQPPIGRGHFNRTQTKTIPYRRHRYPCTTDHPYALRQGCGRSIRRGSLSVEHFRQRADECRHLASIAPNESDKAFWLGLVARWQALEIQQAQQPVRDKSRSPLRRQS
jgi:hypothetical protein